ncbi:MAG: LPS export ABC transporter periplasmic protein LptC [Syntrophales bacterium]|nr:LPS export ABC transporter periplasmic protein LptC [Syntrophales bacterium]
MKIGKRKTIITGALIGVVLLSVAGMFTYWSETPYTPFLKMLPPNIALRVKNVHYTQVGDSDTKWEIKADTARYLKKENLVSFDKVTLTLNMRDGKTFVMTGDRGLLNTNTKDVGILGNVSIISDKGDHLTTDSLTYSQREKRFHTNSAIVMENPRMRVEGVGMSLSLQNGELTLFSRVSALER